MMKPINLIQHELLLRELSRRKLLEFVKYTYEAEYLAGWFHMLLCNKLEEFFQKVQNKESPRLMVMVPPRHGKSEIVSRRFPAWCFGRDPNLSFISASYSADLASRMNRDTQRVLDSTPCRNLFPESALSGKNVKTIAQGSFLRNSDIFEIVGHRGVYRSAGIGGGITGMGCDILNIDDPLKDRKDADSATIRKNILDWYTSTALTRLSPGGGVVLTMTRWHSDDLAGSLLQDMEEGVGDVWEVLRFPAIAEVDEEFRKEGEALHPERYPLTLLNQYKRVMPDRDWASLYQQSPVVEGGNVFNEAWFNYYKPADLPKKFDATCQSWDMAFKDTDSSDFVVGQVWGRHGANFYLLDQIRGRMDFVTTAKKVVDTTIAWPKVRVKLIEEKANGAAVISFLKRKVLGMLPVVPEESKLARAYSVTPLFQAGNVFIPDPAIAPWVTAYRRELTQFPAGAHDDQVDATTQALNYLADKRTTTWRNIL